MAMSKREKQAHEAEVQKLRLRLALRWTEMVEPDVMPPESGDPGRKLVTGWMPHGGTSVFYTSVEPACSSSIYHAVGRVDDTTTQGARALHGSRLKALKALRHKMEVEAAMVLHRIDLEIEKEEVTPTPLPEPTGKKHGLRL